MRSWIFRPHRVLRWASCRSSWPSPTWQRPYLVAMFLHCVPLPQAGPPIMKMIRGDLRMSGGVARGRGGERVWHLQGPACTYVTGSTT